MYTLKDKAVLVTGGGGEGVGLGVCDAVAEAGGRLLINDIDESGARAAAKRYQNAVALPGDISRPGTVEAIFKKAAEQVGTLHGLVNNAGVGLSKPFHQTSPEEFERLFGVDVRGVWLMSRAFVRQALRAKTAASIVNVSSVHSRATESWRCSYAGAKGMVEAFTRGLAVEYGEVDIRVNAIAPGYVHSEQGFDMIRTWTDDPQAWIDNLIYNDQALPHLIEPLDCGRVAAFLLSDFSRAITGQTLFVDAGLTSMLKAREPDKPKARIDD